MVMFGLDISHHQDAGLDLARCKREGISFVFLKATEGSGFVDSEFATNLAEARRAGLHVAAYHYVKGNVSASAQVAHISRVVPKNVPVIPDTEAGGGWLPLTRELVTKLRAVGYRVPLLYLPRWYWQQIGSPSLTGLPPLWSSRYPDNVQGSIRDEWADVPDSYWAGYGGLPVAVLQFTSSARIAGYAPIDANAYRGTAAQLAALLGGVVEEDMEANDPVVDPGPGKWGWEWLRARQQGDAVRNHTEQTVIPKLTAIQASVAAIANDPDIDTGTLGQLIDAAVAEHTPTVEQTVGALLPVLSQVIRDVMGEDNAAQADAIVNALVNRLAA